MIAVLPWLFLGLVGAWMLLTGRKLIFGFPIGLGEGWTMRLFGLAYCLAGAYFTSSVVNGGLPRPVLLTGYAALAGSFFAEYFRRRKASI